MSPLARGALIGLVVAALLAWPAMRALDRLAAARATQAAAGARGGGGIVARPIAGPSTAAASDALAALLRARAARGGLTIERAAPLAGAGPARVVLAVRGPASALYAFVAGVEGGAPTVRFAAWRFERAAAGELRLTGEAVAAWR